MPLNHGFVRLGSKGVRSDKSETVFINPAVIRPPRRGFSTPYDTAVEASRQLRRIMVGW
ncbi:hypothetical protein SCLCIDRAFT_1218954 [Scleroderma citrinum Foug A]|uniref:Uncharacterized protein n=1 Tax=Scleroderma citrinum Foug A TaxID=1036808 RepID=A0A0C3DP90_9AGAM|nr:hypothetical protein SCLCIDRAFT_1218954 [Scleroderma citrinum Foug A]